MSQGQAGKCVEIVPELDSLINGASITHIVQETFHVNFLENKPNVAGASPTWLFDIDSLSRTMNYHPVSVANQTNLVQGFKTLLMQKSRGGSYSKICAFSCMVCWDLNAEFEECSNNSSIGVNAASSSVPTAGHNFINRTNNFSEADINSLESSIPVNPIPTTRIHKDHPISQIIGDLSSTTQTRSMVRAVKDQGGLSQMFDKDFHTCMFDCFLSQVEPKRIHQSLKDPSWINAMQEEILQFKLQKVWILVDLPYGKRVIGTKWVYRNKKDEKGIVIRNKVRLVTQGHTQEEGIDYEEVFSPVARIKAIRLFLAYASFMGFLVYQMDVKSAFLYGTIKEKVYVCQPLGFKDPDHPDKVYKVVNALYELHQAPRAWYETLATYLLENDGIIFGATNKNLCKSFKKLMKDRFQMSSMGELTLFLGLQVNQKKDGIFISQDKYVAEILRKFRLTEGKSASTPIDAEKPLLKDFNGEDVDVHTYRSMIGSLMYLTSSRPDIMFAQSIPV
nr:hypothetical protein [Tanacetum cinerariifolium]